MNCGVGSLDVPFSRSRLNRTMRENAPESPLKRRWCQGGTMDAWTKEKLSLADPKLFLARVVQEPYNKQH